MIVNCPSCGFAAKSDDINIRRMVAKCSSCNEVFPLDPTLSRSPHQRARVPQPPSITVKTQAGEIILDGGYRDAAGPARTGGIVITRRWFALPALFALLFAGVWDSFIFVWYQTALSGDHVEPVMLLFPLVHVAAGVYITYTAIAGLVNTTEVRVADGRLRVKHGPLPWRGNLDLDASKLRQLFVRRRDTSSRRSSEADRSFYALSADMNGEILDVIRTLPNADEARFIEQTVETHLEIVDDPNMGDA